MRHAGIFFWIGIAALFLSQRLPGQSCGLFQPAQSFAAGDAPSSVVAAHLDGDGILDLATGNTNSDNVSVLIGNGNGTFQPAQSFAAGDGARSAVAAHLDADAILDLATANWLSHNVSVLIGNGDGTFQSAQSFATGSFPRSVAAAHLDGDGILDLATASQESDNVSVLIGTPTTLDCNTNGVPDVCDLAIDFTSPDSHTVGSLPEFLTAAKMDGDDRIDLVVPNFNSDTISLLINAGGGTFQNAVHVAAGNGPTFVTAAQLDNTGGADLVVANQLAGNVRVLRNFSAGSFESNQTYTVGNEPTSVVAAALDNDAHLDLAVANFSSGTISVLFNDGTGLFQAAPAPLTAGPSPAVVTAADVVGDDLLDLIVANNVSSGTVSVFRNLGNQNFSARVTCPVGSRPYTVIAADLNGDGDMDLATANTTNSVSVLLNTGGAGCPFDTVTYAVGATQHAVAAADINKDGHLDLAFANFDTGDVGVLLNRGDGTFSASDVLSFDVQAGLLGLAAADLDGDDVPDLAVSRRAGAGGLPNGTTVSVLLNGTTSFDCNSNGVPDECDIVSGTSQDTNSNGRPDACEPFLLPGDCNQDAALDLSDALCGLGVLFTGNPPLFPCGDGTPTDPGNIGLMDWQPDGGVDLSDVLGLLQFFFFSADAHPLAVPGAETTACVPIAGCSNNSNCP